MPDQEWDVQDFFQRFRDGEFDGRLTETLGSLSQEQLTEVERFMIEGRYEIEQDDF
jgi:hypothetical protein